MDRPPDRKMDPQGKPERHDAAIEQWLRDEVILGHQEYLADPSRGVPAEDILARIKACRTGKRRAS